MPEHPGAVVREGGATSWSGSGTLLAPGAARTVAGRNGGLRGEGRERAFVQEGKREEKKRKGKEGRGEFLPSLRLKKIFSCCSHGIVCLP